MTVVLFTLTFINVCIEVYNMVNHNIVSCYCELTSAVKSISIQQVPYPTAAGKTTNSIGTVLLTASICSTTLIDI